VSLQGAISDSRSSILSIPCGGAMSEFENPVVHVDELEEISRVMGE
jgi:hypothetical protein